MTQKTAVLPASEITSYGYLASQQLLRSPAEFELLKETADAFRAEVREAFAKVRTSEEMSDANSVLVQKVGKEENIEVFGLKAVILGEEYDLRKEQLGKTD